MTSNDLVYSLLRMRARIEDYIKIASESSQTGPRSHKSKVTKQLKQLRQSLRVQDEK